MRDLLLIHSHRYPLWQIEDLYKLIYQAALGSEHALVNAADARQWLRQEFASLGPGPEEPLVDPISPGGEVARVHLRPLAHFGGDPEPLLTAFVETAEAFRGSVERLEWYAAQAIRAAQQGELPFPAEAFFAFTARMRAAGFPAVHHSAAFRAAYRPAYRVVMRALLPPAWLE